MYTMKIDEFKKSAADIKILDKIEERDLYSHDIGDIPIIMSKHMFKTLPDLIVQPQNINEIKRVLEIANNLKIPVLVRGAGFLGFWWSGSRLTPELLLIYLPSGRSGQSILTRRPLLLKLGPGGAISRSLPGKTVWL